MVVFQVDDEEDILTLSKLALQVTPGIEVHQFRNGQEAIAGAPDIRPDLLLLDFMMPGLDGLQTLRALREVPGYEAIPAVFITAKSTDIHGTLWAAGAVAVIRKPFEAMALAHQLLSLHRQYGRSGEPT